MKKIGELLKIAEQHKDVIDIIFQIPHVFGVGVNCFSESGREVTCLIVKVEKNPDLIQKILAKEIDGLRVVIEVGTIPSV